MKAPLEVTLVIAVAIVGFTLSRNSFFRGLFVGLSVVYILKYGIFGLTKWDAVFHPERADADTNGPFKEFARPLLQGVWNK